MTRPIFVALMMLALLSGCATPPEQAKTPETSAMPESDSEPAEPAVPESAPLAPKRPQLTGPAAKAEVQKILRQSFEWLDGGEEEKARVELEYARQLEPDNKQVACLYRGVTADPLAALGSESTPYTVRPGESLGTIARRAMGDVCEFYILARYNQIKVPKQLASGQTIRIPGRTALAAPSAADAAPAPVVAPKPEPAPAVETAKPKPVISPEAEEKARRAAIDRHHRSAQAAYRRQDLNTAIREWDAVLAIDPNNGLALARKQEALDLQRRLENLKK